MASPIRTQPRQSQDSLDSIELETLKKLLKYSPSDANEKIAEIVSLLLHFKEIRTHLSQNSKCQEIYCKNVPCALKNLLKDINRVSQAYTRQAQAGLTSLIDIFIRAYQPTAPFDSPLDLFLLFLHSFSISSCYAHVSSYFKLRLCSSFSCLCGQKLVINSEASHFTVQVNLYSEFLAEYMHRVLKAQLSGQIHKFCPSSACGYKQSRKSVEVMQLPVFVLFKLNWNEEVDVNYVLQSIKPEFNISEFSQNLSGVYKASVIFLETTFLYEESGKWLSKRHLFLDYSKMIEEFIRCNTKILGVIYQKIQLGVNGNSTDQRILTPSIEVRPSLVKSPQAKCKVCLLERCQCKYFCKTCNSAVPNYGVYCEDCKNQTDHKYSTFSNSKCVICNSTISSGSICASCTYKQSLISTPAKKSPQEPVLICRICKAHIQEGTCNYCSNISTTVTCPTCKNKGMIDCKACKSKTPVRRTASSTINKKKCVGCIKFLNKEEETNCSKCFRQVGSLPCSQCHTTPIRYICNSCMKSKNARLRGSRII